MYLRELVYQVLKHGQKFLVYPSAFEGRPRDIELPSSLGLSYEDLELYTEDHVTLRCFLIRMGNDTHPATMKPARATVIMFHGNGMNHGDLIWSAKKFTNLNCNVITLSYRGYGNSDGSPSERGLCKDAQVALVYILNHPDLSKIPTILYGASLGGAVAIDLASRNPDKITALIVENTFISLPAVIRDWPGTFGRFSFLCTQKWNSGSKLLKIPTTVSILMMSGLADQVVSPNHMLKLWEIASERGKKTHKSRNTGYSPPEKDIFQSFVYGEHHNTYIQPQYWDHVEEFISNVLPRSEY